MDLLVKMKLLLQFYDLLVAERNPRPLQVHLRRGSEAVVQCVLIVVVVL